MLLLMRRAQINWLRSLGMQPWISGLRAVQMLIKTVGKRLKGEMAIKEKIKTAGKRLKGEMAIKEKERLLGKG